MRSWDQSALRMYWSSAGCFQPSLRVGLSREEFVSSTFLAEALSPITPPISKRLNASSERGGIRVDRLFADPEMEVVADEGGTDSCGDCCMNFCPINRPDRGCSAMVKSSKGIKVL